ncbi:unnamed protein product [Cuscuta europaea]|uniref:Mitochondrial inner membrane protease ATP23 n=1 Tax=Cuscuta europaea TaxID=41803 RepID=A0A9P1E6K2_CUSEU|nr:unnamed protein product [Cuscuta europaea]
MKMGNDAGTGSTVKGGKTVEECQRMIQKSLRTPMVKFLRERVEKAGCGMGENFFKAIRCDQSVGGGYAPGEGIVVCSNHMNIQDEVNQVVIHALIHAYDDCRANIDWTDCAHLACSKIRANHLSGDCHYKREFLRGNLKIRGHEQFVPGWERYLELYECKLPYILNKLLHFPWKILDDGVRETTSDKGAEASLQ